MRIFRQPYHQPSHSPPQPRPNSREVQLCVSIRNNLYLNLPIQFEYIKLTRINTDVKLQSQLTFLRIIDETKHYSLLLLGREDPPPNSKIHKERLQSPQKSKRITTRPHLLSSLPCHHYQLYRQMGSLHSTRTMTQIHYSQCYQHLGSLSLREKKLQFLLLKLPANGQYFKYKYFTDNRFYQQLSMGQNVVNSVRKGTVLTIVKNGHQSAKYLLELRG